MENLVASLEFSTNGYRRDLNEEKSSDGVRSKKLISDADRRWLEIMFFVAFTGTVSVFGSITNIINIVIFIKQGFKDTVNISLLGLAVSDLGALLVLVWQSICFNPLFRYSDIPFESIDVQYISAGWPHVCFARITSWITAFVTFERCICIALPLKVKNIMTAKRTTFVVVAIFVLMFLSVSPVYYSIHIGSTFFVGRNTTLLGLVYADHGPFIENISFSISVFSQLSSFLIVIVCTVTLIQNLLSKSDWRKTVSGTSASGATDTSATRRDKRVVKMVAFISCIFIACFLPSAVNLILMICFSPEYSIVGQYQNTFQVSWSILNTLEATNSSVNIFVYYRMSTKYRGVFHELFGIERQKIRDG